jgi:hypothetical protein
VSENNVAQPPLSQGSATVIGMGQLLGYARVSTTDQQPHLQVDALTAAGCYRVFTETASNCACSPKPIAWTHSPLLPRPPPGIRRAERLGLLLEVERDQPRAPPGL